AELFRQHHVDLVRLATILVRSRETAEDLVQDVFTAIQGRAGGLARPDDALPYLRSAILNRCRFALRRKAVARRFHDLRGTDYGRTRAPAASRYGPCPSAPMAPRMALPSAAIAGSRPGPAAGKATGPGRVLRARNAPACPASARAPRAAKTRATVSG